MIRNFCEPLPQKNAYTVGEDIEGLPIVNTRSDKSLGVILFSDPGSTARGERRPVRIGSDAAQLRDRCRVEHVIRCSPHAHLPFTGMDRLWALTHDRDDNAKA